MLSSLQQFFRYGTIGLVTNTFIFLSYLVMTGFDFEPKLTMSVLYFAGVAASYLLNKNLTFLIKSQNNLILIKFLIAHCIGYSLNWLLIYYFSDTLHYSHQVVQAFSIVTVALFLFLVFKFFVFYDNRN